METFRNLIVWQKSMELVKEIYVLTARMPKDEAYGLSTQIRRAAVSIPSNIAEGYGRNASKDYIRFLMIARGSKNEVETQLEICTMLSYFSQEQTNRANALCDEIGKMLNALIGKLQSAK